jgi:hypothetical protein
MHPLAVPLAQSPELFPQGLDLGTDSLSLVRLREADYAKASFLDGRNLTPGTMTRTLPFADVRAAVEDSGLTERCDFIFHISHVGSTLLSRLLGRHPDVFALREPGVLRTLAQLHVDPDRARRLWNDAEFEAHLSTLLKLWSRTFRPEQRAMIKATSFTSELAAMILARPSQPKAVFMFVPLEGFLATILGAENSPREVQMLAPLRALRLQRRIGDPIDIAKMSMGELVAMGWASEMLALTDALPAAQHRAIWLDFDSFLAAPERALAACFAHFEIAASDALIAQIVSGPDMRTYSKAQEYDYDAKLRHDVLAQARAQHGAEIRLGLVWLEKMSAKHPSISSATSIRGAG